MGWQAQYNIERASVGSSLYSKSDKEYKVVLPKTMSVYIVRINAFEESHAYAMLNINMKSRIVECSPEKDPIICVPADVLAQIVEI